MIDTSRAWIEIDHAALRHNVREMRGCVGAETALMAVVKSNGYGHDLVPTSQTFVEAGCAWLGIAAVEEGLQLREAGITAPICILCPVPPTDASRVVALNLTPLVGDNEFAQALAESANSQEVNGFPIHLDIDTGMGRSGVLAEEAVSLYQKADRLGLRVEGLVTHFSCADSEDLEFSDRQWAQFLQIRRELEAIGARFRWIHAANSPATLRYDENGCNLVRPGILLFGYPLSPQLSTNQKSRQFQPDLVPALTLKARVASIRVLPSGFPISYGADYRLKRDSRVATLTIGYGDGLPRRLSNCGSVLLHRRHAPIIGRICMDQTVVDVTDIPEAQAGDIAICIGRDSEVRIEPETVAQQIGGIVHEVLASFTSRLPYLHLNT